MVGPSQVAASSSTVLVVRLRRRAHQRLRRRLRRRNRSGRHLLRLRRATGERLRLRWSDNCAQLIVQIPREALEAVVDMLIAGTLEAL